MGHRFTHWHLKDWRFIGFIVLGLACISTYLGINSARLEQSSSGWRRIDMERVQHLMDSGELSGREAEWYTSPTRGFGKAECVSRVPGQGKATSNSSAYCEEP